MITCPQCNKTNEDSALFCDNCGASLAGVARPSAAAAPVVAPAAAPAAGAVCPACGTPFVPGEAFCGNCGAQLPAAPPIAPAAPPAAPAYTPPSGPVQPPAAVPAPPAAPPVAPAAAASGQCHNCGAAVLPGQAFCGNCGAQLTPAPPAPPAAVASGQCHNCGAAVLSGQAFCDNCGAQLTPAPPAPPPPAPTPLPPSPAPSPVAPVAQPPYAPTPSAPGARPRLVVAGSGAQFDLTGKTEALIGREDPISGIFPQIDLTPHGGEAGGVSRRHARIALRGGQWTIEDLNSTNFTFVNNQRLNPGAPQALNNGDQIRLGRVVLAFYSM